MGDPVSAGDDDNPPGRYLDMGDPVSAGDDDNNPFCIIDIGLAAIGIAIAGVGALPLSVTINN